MPPCAQSQGFCWATATREPSDEPRAIRPGARRSSVRANVRQGRTEWIAPLAPTLSVRFLWSPPDGQPSPEDVRAVVSNEFRSKVVGARVESLPGSCGLGLRVLLEHQLLGHGVFDNAGTVKGVKKIGL